MSVTGYAKSATLAYQALKEGKTVRQLALEQKLLPKTDLDKLLDVMAVPRGRECRGDKG